MSSKSTESKSLKKRLVIMDTYEEGIDDAMEMILAELLDLYLDSSEDDEEEDKCEEELMKCPICGSTAKLHRDPDSGYWYIECIYCPLGTADIFESKEAAIDYWNNRR